MSAITWKILKRALQVLVIAVIFYYLGKQLFVNWEKVVAYEWQINYFYLLLSVISVIITFFIISSIWRWIIFSFGKQVGYAKAFKISYLANLGRYIPGKIWQVFGFIYLAKKEGITEGEAVTAFGIALTFTLPPAIFSGLLYLALYPGFFAEFIGIPFFAAGVIIFGVGVLVISIMMVFFPRPFERIINAAFKLLKRRPIRIEIDKGLAVKLYVGYFLAWSLYGFSFWLFLKGIIAQNTALFPMMGLFIIAYQVGYLALFAPGGVGPREVVMQLLLTPFFGPAVSAAIAIAARLWLIIAEAISALIALRIR